MTAREAASRKEPPFSLGALIGFRLVIVTVLLFVAGYLGAIQDPDVEPNRAIFALISAAFGLNLIYAILLGLASYRVQAWSQVLGDLVVVSAFVYLTGDDRAGFIVLYPIVVLYGAIILGRGFSLAAIATLLYASMILLARFQKIPGYGLAVLASGSPRGMTNAIALMALSVLVVAGLGEGVSRSLARAGQSLDEAAGRFANLQELNRIIVESIQTGLVLTDASDRIVFVNELGANTLGVEPGTAVNRTPVEIFATDRVDPGPGPHEIGQELRIEIERPRETGTQILGLSIVNLGGDLRGGRLFAFRDMTEVRRLEEQARLNEKLAAVGGMAAQMAHEIRNPLGAISAAAKLMAGTQGEDSEGAQLLGIIARESQRLSSTVDAYLRGLRSAENTDAVCDLVVSVRETARLLQMGPEASERHELRVETAHDSVKVKISADELSQVLWNLGRNALEAMPRGGTVTLRVTVADGFAVTDVEDQGQGFDQRRLKRLFEPLQTTKASGTGLGLAIAHRLVRQRGGELSVNSSAGRGARVVFSLPLAATSGEARA